MKKIGLFILSMITLFTVTSCGTMIYADSVVEAYGVPHYDSYGVIVYYEYQHMYYYPQYIHGRYRLKACKRPIPSYMPPRRTPTPPRGHFSTPPRTPSTTRRPAAPQRPNTTPSRRPTPNRTAPRGSNITHFGGRR